MAVFVVSRMIIGDAPTRDADTILDVANREAAKTKVVYCMMSKGKLYWAFNWERSYSDVFVMFL